MRIVDQYGNVIWEANPEQVAILKDLPNMREGIGAASPFLGPMLGAGVFFSVSQPAPDNYVCAGGRDIGSRRRPFPSVPLTRADGRGGINTLSPAPDSLITQLSGSAD